MIIWSEDSSRNTTLNKCEYVLGKIAEGFPDYLNQILNTADLGTVSLACGLSMWKTHFYILPRSDSAFLSLSECWHDKIGQTFTERNYEYNQVQQQIAAESQRLYKKSMTHQFDLIAKCFELTDLGVEAHSEAMHEALEPMSIEQQKQQLDFSLEQDRLSELLEAAADPPEKRIYTKPFERHTQSDGFHPPIFIDLKPLNWFLAKDWHQSYWAISKGRKRGLYLKSTRRPHKHERVNFHCAVI